MKINSVEAYWAHSRSLRPPSPAGFIVEYWLGANPLLHDLIEETFPVRDGLIEILDRAGFGLPSARIFSGRIP